MKLRSHLIVLLLFLTAAPLWADWKSEIGFTRLQSLAGGELPTAPNAGLTQVEAYDPETTNYAPNTASSLFNGKALNVIGSSGTSNHAHKVATNFYATTSLLPGSCSVDIHYVNDWIYSGFLKYGTSSAPLTETRAVQNHSWVGSLESSSADTNISRRLDFAINRDGFVCAVGLHTADAEHPQLLCQTYNTISVGLDDGRHTQGLTTLDGSGRMKPDIVTPNTGVDYTSYATPIVAGAAGLLYQRLVDDYSLSENADRPRVIKAILLASATKNTVPNWDNTPTRPLDSIYGAGELNIHHAYHTLRAGRATANNTHYSIRGWAAESVGGSSTKTCYFKIPAGTPSTPFSAALIWHRNVTTALSGNGRNQTRTWNASLADLNLRLYQASGTSLGSLITESNSAVDNVELIYQSALAPGDYALRVENTSTTSTAYALAWHSLPAVTVAATVSTAREIDGQTGFVTLTRTGNTSLPLYVPLSIGGTAVPGSHYQALPANVTIPAGQASTSLQITPVPDALAQGDRSVSVTVAADFALVRDPGLSGTVMIEDKPFDAWRFARFTAPELANPALSGETADPDRDQLANLIEYALGLEPKTPDTSPVGMTNSGGYLALATAKNPEAADITWAAQVTADLENWSPAVVLTNTPDTFEARDTVLKSAADKRLIRLKITRP